MREDTKAALKEYEISSFMFRKKIEEAEELIGIDEKVICVLTPTFVITYPDPTKKEMGVGIVIVTDQNIILYHRPRNEGISYITPMSKVNDIKLVTLFKDGSNNIQVYTDEKIFNFTLPAVGGSFKLSSGSQNIANKIFHAFMFAKNGNTFAGVSDSDVPKETSGDIPSQIEKLAELKDKGIITEEEFQTKKQDLLSRI